MRTNSPRSNAACASANEPRGAHPERPQGVAELLGLDSGQQTDDRRWTGEAVRQQPLGGQSAMQHLGR